MWESGLMMARVRPWLGFGPGGVKREYRRFALEEAHKKRTGHVHNTPLQILVERGVIGLAAWLWIWVAFYAYAIRVLRRLAPDAVAARTVVIGSLAAITGFLVGGLSEYNFGDSEVVMVGLGHRGPASRSCARDPRRYRERGRAQYVAYGSVDERTLTKYSLSLPTSSSETRSEIKTHSSPCCFHMIIVKPLSLRTSGRQRSICTRPRSGRDQRGQRQDQVGHGVAVRVLIRQLHPPPPFEGDRLGVDELDLVVAAEHPVE